MQLLIDGYNVLFAAGAMPRRSGPGELARSREWLLKLLFDHLETCRLAATTIVFDAKDGPRHLSPEYHVRGVQVLFARDHEEADDLIETLIRQHASPKKLTVVTSDLRLREAARRRRCRVVPSDEWLDFIVEQQPAATSSREASRATRPDSRDVPIGDGEVEEWLQFFGSEPLLPAEPATKGPKLPPAPTAIAQPRSSKGVEPRSSGSRPKKGPPPDDSAKKGAEPRPANRAPAQRSRRSSSPAADQSPPGKADRATPSEADRAKPSSRRKAPFPQKPLDRETLEWSPFPPGYGEDLLEPPPS